MMLSWEQKLEAIKALGGDVSLRMRKPGDWYMLTTGVEIGGDGMLRSTGGNGTTPQEAVETAWHTMTSIEYGRYIVVNAYSENRRQVRWNGFMWVDVHE